MRRTTTAEVRPDAGRARRSIGVLTACRARGTRFSVAQDGRRDDPGSQPPGIRGMSDHRFLDRATRSIERWIASPIALAGAVSLIIAWGIAGAFMGWSQEWIYILTTVTHIITFLIVFIIQNTQSRDTRAIQAKLDELIRVNQYARNSLVNLEDQPDKQIDAAKDNIQ